MSLPAKQESKKAPSTFALLIDDISKMSASKQKLLWMQINQEKLSAFAEELDKNVVENNFTPDEINSLIQEAKNDGRKEKKS